MVYDRGMEPSNPSEQHFSRPRAEVYLGALLALSPLVISMNPFLKVGIWVSIALLSYDIVLRSHWTSRWLVPVKIIICVAIAGLVGWQAWKAWNSSLPHILLEPTVELGIGKPFASSTLIAIKNAGVEPITDVAVNLRCFFLKTDTDTVPLLLSEGFLSIGNANSWWRIDVIDPNTPATKEALESVDRCLSNSEKFGLVYARQIFSVDLSYRRSGDNKEYKLSGIANLAKDHNTGKPFLWPENISEFYQHMLESRTPPVYSIKP